MTLTVVDGSGQDDGVLAGPTVEAAGTHSAAFAAAGLADGAYEIRIDAVAAEGAVPRTVAVLVTRTLGSVGVAPQAFSPNGDGRADRLSVRFTLVGPAAVRVRVLRGGTWVATLFAGDLPAGPHVVRWDGSKRVGRLLDGAYTAEVDATDTVTTSAAALPFVADTRAPVVRILPGAPLRISISEPAVLKLRVNGSVQSVSAPHVGVLRIPGAGPAARVRVVAWDAAGNVSRPAVRA